MQTGTCIFISSASYTTVAPGNYYEKTSLCSATQFNLVVPISHIVTTHLITGLSLNIWTAGATLLDVLPPVPNLCFYCNE